MAKKIGTLLHGLDPKLKEKGGSVSAANSPKSGGVASTPVKARTNPIDRLGDYAHPKRKK